jgi:hypothetical protein
LSLLTLHNHHEAYIASIFYRGHGLVPLFFIKPETNNPMKKTEKLTHPNLAVYALMMVTVLLLACMWLLRG